MRKLTNFFKYNNAFILILGFLFLAAGSSFASETVRDAVIGQTIEETKGMDNSALLSADLNSLKQEMAISDVSEDEANYYITYSFSTFDIKDNAWQTQTKNQTLKVPKEALNGGKDLGLYVQSELAQIMDSQLVYLKDAQEREQKKGVTKIIQTTKYTGLKGLILNSETKELEGYEPVVEKTESSSSTADSSTFASSSSQTASSSSVATSSSSESSANSQSSISNFQSSSSSQFSSENDNSSSSSAGGAGSSSISSSESSSSSSSSLNQSSSAESSSSSESSYESSSSEAVSSSSSSSITSSSSSSSETSSSSSTTASESSSSVSSESSSSSSSSSSL